jgi:hypothetical protein
MLVWGAGSSRGAELPQSGPSDNEPSVAAGRHSRALGSGRQNRSSSTAIPTRAGRRDVSVPGRANSCAAAPCSRELSVDREELLAHDGAGASGAFTGSTGLAGAALPDAVGDASLAGEPFPNRSISFVR